MGIMVDAEAVVIRDVEMGLPASGLHHPALIKLLHHALNNVLKDSNIRKDHTNLKDNITHKIPNIHKINQGNHNILKIHRIRRIHRDNKCNLAHDLIIKNFGSERILSLL